MLLNEVRGGSCGGLAIYRCEKGSVLNTNISNNSAFFDPATHNPASGGGMCIELSERIIVEHSNFDHNFAATVGGGIKFLKVIMVSLLSSSLKYNRATAGGSLGILTSANVTILKVTFEDSTAANDGGSIDIEESIGVVIEESEFARSSSLNGDGSSIS